MSVEYTPPPPDFLEPPESPFRGRSRTLPARDAENGAADGGKREGTERQDEAEREGEDWDVDAEMGIDAGPSADRTEQKGRVSMYVKLFDEMITTVLASEEYLFTKREAWVLRYILSLPYEPHYLLTRLLLRRAGKVFPLSSLVDAYSGEIGEEGVKRAARTLAWELELPASITEEEEASRESSPEESDGKGKGKGKQTDNESDREGTLADDTAARPNGTATRTRPWAHISTGLSSEEEAADPDLAEAIRQSTWADESGVTVDEYLRICEAEERGGSTDGSRAGPSCAGIAATDDTDADADADADESTAPAQINTSFSLKPLPSPPITRLAHDDSELSLADLMTCIPVDELRRVARGRKIPQTQLASRESTMTALRNLARQQTTLNFGGGYKGKGKARADAAPKTTTSEHLIVAQLLPLVGGHVLQIDRGLYTLIARVNLIFSRVPPASTSQPALLLPPILVQSNKRHYPDYGAPTRTCIWDSRDDMLTWERAVSWEVLVSEALGDIWAQARTGAVQSVFAPRGQPLPRTECAKIVRKVWEEVWPIWKAMVARDVPPSTAVGGDRFRTEHVLTRVVAKGAEALGVLHEYDLECEVLRALLAQRRWRRGKRGAWYERLALVLMTHYRGIPTAEERTAKLEDATQVCIDGLLDHDTHLIYRPGLSKRLTRLENKLNLPPEERHISFAQLLTCETRELVAVRSAQNAGVPKVKEMEVDDVDDDIKPVQQVGKSAWVGREGEVTVEGWVLEWWEDRGYQGYHAESSILTTLFALLMWPVLFHPLPGAFETLYQTAPLDLGEDGFARARSDIMEARLAEMEDTDAALRMLREVDERERPRGTWAVGLSWDFGAAQLAEILECIGGSAMATICRMLGEEYRHRASGVPDLIVWNYDAKEARFVEVKGPGDNLSETQKIWIDVLLSAGVPVEVCRVKDKDDEERRAKEEKEREESRKQKQQQKPKPKRTSSTTSTTTKTKTPLKTSGSAAWTPTKPMDAAPRRNVPKRKASAASARDLGGSSRDEPIVLDDSDEEEDVKRRKV